MLVNACSMLQAVLHVGLHMQYHMHSIFVWGESGNPRLPDYGRLRFVGLLQTTYGQQKRAPHFVGIFVI